MFGTNCETSLTTRNKESLGPTISIIRQVWPEPTGHGGLVAPVGRARTCDPVLGVVGDVVASRAALRAGQSCLP